MNLVSILQRNLLKIHQILLAVRSLAAQHIAPALFVRSVHFGLSRMDKESEKAFDERFRFNHTYRFYVFIILWQYMRNRWEFGSQRITIEISVTSSIVKCRYCLTFENDREINATPLLLLFSCDFSTTADVIRMVVLFYTASKM